jgi:hypothetical protein
LGHRFLTGTKDAVQRREDPFHPSVRCLLRTEQDAGTAARRATERREEGNVLIGAVQYKPAATRTGNAGDLSILSAPSCASKSVPAAEG